MTSQIAKGVDFAVKEFSRKLGGIQPEHNVRDRPDGEFLIFQFALPTERLYAALESVIESLPKDSPFINRIAITRRHRKPANVVSMPETRMLQKELSESLTVDRHTFGDDFFSRYISSVNDFEQNIVGNANFVVFGRRGSGKSSLLAYAMHMASRASSPFAWIALQTYAGRNDDAAIASVLSEVMNELSEFDVSGSAFGSLSEAFTEIALAPLSKKTHNKILRLLPEARKAVGKLTSRANPLTVFLDDLHVLGTSLQSRLLSSLYAITRGNHAYIKASGIEQFTSVWDSSTRQGLEPPHDVQVLKLDHNLTMPDRSQAHIVSILDAHARYCGLPDIRYLAGDDVLSRLVLSAAAVPRDALSLFSQAITKSSVRGQKAVTVTAINAAASETIEEKLRDIERDADSQDDAALRDMLDRLKDFCVRKKKVNAFLVKIDSRSSDYNVIQKLIALRFVHILHEGITPHRAGERYIALMLDFGFYIGIRASRNVKLFMDIPKVLAAKDLRKLPIF